jgi:hypothetical protein
MAQVKRTDAVQRAAAGTPMDAGYERRPAAEAETGLDPSA